jgi:hypothetical protein
VPQARQILRALLQDRIEFTPGEHAGHRVYRYRGTFSVGAQTAQYYRIPCSRVLLNGDSFVW